VPARTESFSAGVRLLLLVMFWGLTVGKLKAQSAQALSLQGSGLFNGVFGDVFTGLKDGIGAEAQLRYTPSAFSIGAGFQYTSHELEGRSEDARLYGGFLEPRYRIHAGSNVVAPYVSARFSVLKVGFSGGDLSLSSTFIQLNGGGGLLYRLGSQINLDVGATYGYNRLGDGTLTNESAGTSVPVESSSGSNIVVRIGLAIGLGA
jgi:Outer membrane protein beta-barrel domain